MMKSVTGDRASDSNVNWMPSDVMERKGVLRREVKYAP